MSYYYNCISDDIMHGLHDGEYHDRNDFLDYFNREEIPLWLDFSYGVFHDVYVMNMTRILQHVLDSEYPVEYWIEYMKTSLPDEPCLDSVLFNPDSWFHNGE